MAVEIARLLAAFGQRNEADASLKLRMEAYMDALGELPAEAIVQARKAVIRGEAGIDLRFAPSPPEFAQVAKVKLHAIKTEILRCTAIAEAIAEPVEREQTEEEKERAKLLFEIIAATVSGAAM